jgi:hypothetical protein
MSQPPKLYRGKKPKKVSVKTVFQAVHEISMHSSAQQFLQECERRDLKVSVDAELVNLVKTLLHDAGAHQLSMASASIVDSDTC